LYLSSSNSFLHQAFMLSRVCFKKLYSRVSNPHMAKTSLTRLFLSAVRTMVRRWAMPLASAAFLSGVKVFLSLSLPSYVSRRSWKMGWSSRTPPGGAGSVVALAEDVEGAEGLDAETEEEGLLVAEAQVLAVKVEFKVEFNVVVAVAVAIVFVTVFPPELPAEDADSIWLVSVLEMRSMTG